MNPDIDLPRTEQLMAKKAMFPCKIFQNSKKHHSRPPVNMEQWETHFSNLLGENGRPSSNPQSYTHNSRTQQYDPITTDTVARHIRNCKSNQVTGPDEIFAEHLKTLTLDLAEPLALLFNECLRNNTIPQQWRKSIIVVLHKGKGKKDDPNNYRGIALENTMYKIFSKILLERINQRLRPAIPMNQFGFTAGKSALQAV